jgi:hypothetical protein
MILKKKKPKQRQYRNYPLRWQPPRDSEGNFIVGPIRGWCERRQLMIADLELQLKALQVRSRRRGKPLPEMIVVKRAIKTWQADLAAGIPDNEEYAPRALEVLDERGRE